ncbi:MAG TPA: NAD(P)H-quinone oxidoreductase [Gammaproteobacteria bacterium]|nr:NAD(P)H-quinone oxidoreductase [Gammaproteobacteria bacterium]
MKAICVEQQRLLWADQPIPEPKAHEVRIQVHASALNRADCLQRKGLYPPPPGASTIMGLECAGIIEKAGAEVDDRQIGDPVCALLSGGGFAEYVCVPAAHTLPLPPKLNMTQATAIPEVFATAWLNLFIEANLKPEESVLIHAGASGVGTAALQLCREFNHPVFVTVGNRNKLEYCLSLGAGAGHLRSEGPFSPAVKEWRGGAGVDVILDPVGGGYLEENQQCLNVDGRLVLIGIMGGVTSKLNLGLMLVKRQRLIGSTLRSRTDAFKAGLMKQLQQHLWPKFSTKKVQPVIDREYQINDITAAFAYMESNQSIGKIVLKVV